MAVTKRSGFEGGLIVIPIITFIGGVIFSIMGWKASHSGSTIQTPQGEVVSVENVPFLQTIGILGVILFAATIVIALVMRSER